MTKSVMTHRKIPFENVVRNLKRGKYLGKIMQADYSNLGMRLFDESKFASNLGVSRQFLREIGLVKIKDTAGWKLPAEPAVEELLLKKKRISEKYLEELKEWQKRRSRGR